MLASALSLVFALIPAATVAPPAATARAQVGATERPRAPSAQASDLTLQGRVLDALGEPLVQADVWVSDAEQTEVARGRTDASGFYVLRRLPADGQLHVHATAPGRIQRRLHLPPGTSAQDVRLYDATQVSGRTLDASGAPVPGADVLVVFRHSRELGFDAVARRTTSDAEGRFALDKVPYGNLLFSAAAPGYVCAHVYERVAGERTVDLRLERGAGIGLRLRVTGVPPGHAVRVKASPYGHYGYLPLPPSRIEGTLDGEGRWQADGLPDVTYELKVQAPGLRFEPAMVKVAPGAPHDVEVRAFPTATHTVRGRVVTSDGHALPGQTIIVTAATLTSNVDVVSRATTDRDGSFALPAPVEAGAEARAKLRAHGAWVLAAEAARVFRVTEEPLLLRATPAAVVTGRLVANDGEPADGVAVQFQSESGSSWRTVAQCLSDGKGRFAFYADQPDGRSARVIAVGRVGRGATELTVGERVDIGKLTLAPSSVVQGTVRDPDGRPLPGELVHLKPWDVARGCPGNGPMLETITDREGRYRFPDLDAGERFLIISREPKGGGSDAHRVEVRDGATQTVDILAAAPR